MGLVSSRLLEYEIWTRLHARKATASRAEAAHEVIARISLLELVPPVLARALEPFPVSVPHARRATPCIMPVSAGSRPARASYDDRMADSARALGIPLWGLP